MTRRLRTLLALAVLAVAASAHAAETPIPPAPTRWVTDEVGFLSPSTRATLDSRLAAYERSSGNQIIVYVGPSTGDTPVEDWAVRAFEKWGVGRKGLDDGAVLFVFPQDRRARIEVGYGLEPRVPDVIASRILNEVLIPGIRAGRNDEAVTAATESLVAAASGQPLPQAPPGYARGPQPQPIQGAQLILLLIVGAVLLFFFITHPRLAMLLLWSMMSGGNRRGGGGWGGGGWSGGGGGGGGFSGGGGRSGGGGASGSW